MTTSEAQVLDIQVPGPHTGYMTNTTAVDLSTADVSTNIISFKTKSVAYRKAAEYASMANSESQEAEVVFESTTWNGSESIPVWLYYGVSATDEGWTISSYRWYYNPTSHRWSDTTQEA